MIEPTQEQITAAMLAYDLAITNPSPTFPERLKAMAAALTAALNLEGETK